MRVWWDTVHQGCPAFGGRAAADRELERTRGDVVERRVRRDALERCLKALRAAETRSAAAEEENKRATNDP